MNPGSIHSFIDRRSSNLSIPPCGSSCCEIGRRRLRRAGRSAATEPAVSRRRRRPRSGSRKPRPAVGQRRRGCIAPHGCRALLQSAFIFFRGCEGTEARHVSGRNDRCESNRRVDGRAERNCKLRFRTPCFTGHAAAARFGRAIVQPCLGRIFAACSTKQQDFGRSARCASCGAIVSDHQPKPELWRGVQRKQSTSNPDV